MSGDMESTPASDPRKQQIEVFNKLGAYTIPIIAIVSWGTGMSYCGREGGGWNNIVYSDFSNHIAMMLTGFLLLGSMAVTCYRICSDFGISHNTAKWIHIILNSLVIILIWAGWHIIFECHQASDEEHYKGSHSRIGIVALCLWTLHYVAGFYIFFLAPKPKVVCLLEVHRALGILFLILALWTCALGMMWNEYQYDPQRDEYARSRSGVVVGGLMVVIFGIGMMTYARTLLPK